MVTHYLQMRAVCVTFDGWCQHAHWWIVPFFLNIKAFCCINYMVYLFIVGLRFVIYWNLHPGSIMTFLVIFGTHKKACLWTILLNWNWYYQITIWVWSFTNQFSLWVPKLPNDWKSVVNIDNSDNVSTWPDPSLWVRDIWNEKLVRW